MLFDLKKIENSLNLISASFKKELNSIRTNRPNTELVEDIRVSYYNEETPIKHLGSLGVIPPREIHIQAWDKNAVSQILKAIESSNLGLSVKSEGNIIRIYLPELSEERREELCRYAKKVLEEHKIRVRHNRDEANKEIQKSCDLREISEDQKFQLKEKVQKIVDEVNKSLEEILNNKIKEIKE